MKKTQNFPIFKDFMHFVNVSTDVVDWNVFKGQQEKVGCLVVFNEEIIAMF